MRSLAAVTLAFVLSGGWLFAQDDGLNPAGPLYMLNNGDRLMSASSQGLPGEISQLNFGPGTVPLFSFIRELDGTTTLHILNYLDNELVTVEPAVGNGPADGLSTATYDGQLSWRPQLDRQGRQWFAFVSNKLDNNQEIYLGYLGGEEYVRLTRNSANDFSPQWSPDGDKIAFISKRSGEGDLYLSQSLEKVVDGKSRPSAFIHRQLTDTPLAEAQPAWNPNPKAHLIAFTQRRQFAGRDVATTQIAIIDLGSESFDLYEVTADPLYHFYAPNWEPHSARRLMFVQQSVVQGTTAGIYLVELEWKGGKLHNKILEDYRT
ncbi:MAG TPA: hypothetical protein PLG66_18065, partial [Calditrichia bacterium]|nr:hypothetical protein [Calditrichia bacterium]